MLNHPTLDKLQDLRFTGMAKALTEQMALPDIEELSFEERLGLLVDREVTEREDRRLTTRLRQAKLKHNACIEDIDFKQSRGLDKSLILDLAQCQWIKRHLNLLITGPTGVGKTPARPVSVRPGSPARSHKRLAGKASPHCICVFRGYCRNYRLPKATAPIPAY